MLNAAKLSVLAHTPSYLLPSRRILPVPVEGLEDAGGGWKEGGRTGGWLK
jgi:hypothetical protein